MSRRHVAAAELAFFTTTLLGDISPMRASATVSTDADVAYAVAEVAASRAAVRAIENLAQYDSFGDALSLTRRRPLLSFGAAAVTLTAAQDFSLEQKQVIGSASIDVLASLRSLAGSLEDQDAKGAQRQARLADTGLDQILKVCKAGGLYD